ncbi:hypothetical protein [Psychrobacillus antarcticus]|uniref:hypothetical protein n=1 Tax=Psychrobacillus antarcticus TaxID=2879115 RepID=UPI0024078750|nr:hypothetical protein [Psychrobacillus antarcticus]
MENLKLSQLNDDVEISLEESHSVMTVEQVKREILELNEEHHLAGEWYTVNRIKWEPCALSMVTQYVEDQEDDMYEDWGEQALKHISTEVIQQIQKLLNEAIKGSSVNDVWKYDIPVEIDVFPK